MSVFDPNAIVQPYKDEANSSVPSKIVSKLKESYPDITPEQETKLIQDLSPLFDDLDLNWLSLLSSLTSLLNKLELNIGNRALSNLKANNALNNKLMDSSLKSNRMEQDAETSQKLEEPKAEDTKFSEVVDNQDADNSLAEDYPETYGFVSEAGDYIKINKKQKSIYLVHNSGTRIAVDQNGNTTVYSSGSIKMVADSSMAIAVNGGLDISATDGVYIHGKEINIVSDSDLKIEASDMKVEAQSSVEVKTMDFKVPDAMQVQFPDSLMTEFGGAGKFKMMCSAAGFANG